MSNFPISYTNFFLNYPDSPTKNCFDYEKITSSCEKFKSRVQVITQNSFCQHTIYRNFDETIWLSKLDSLKDLNNFKVSGSENLSELATNIAFTYYPELTGNRIKIKYKKSVRYPVTAGWAFGNFFRFKKSHTYVLLLKPGSFIDRIPLNQLVGVYGHEMAHFIYYKKRPAVNMIWWGIKYTVSKKFRRNFERDADKTAIDHMLGWQILDMSFYMSKSEIRAYLEATYP